MIDRHFPFPADIQIASNNNDDYSTQVSRLPNLNPLITVIFLQWIYFWLFLTGSHLLSWNCLVNSFKLILFWQVTHNPFWSNISKFKKKMIERRRRWKESTSIQLHILPFRIYRIYNIVILTNIFSSFSYRDYLGWKNEQNVMLITAAVLLQNDTESKRKSDATICSTIHFLG